MTLLAGQLIVIAVAMATWRILRARRAINAPVWTDKQIAEHDLNWESYN